MRRSTAQPDVLGGIQLPEQRRSNNPQTSRNAISKPKTAHSGNVENPWTHADFVWGTARGSDVNVSRSRQTVNKSQHVEAFVQSHQPGLDCICALLMRTCRASRDQRCEEASLDALEGGGGRRAGPLPGTRPAYLERIVVPTHCPRGTSVTARAIWSGVTAGTTWTPYRPGISTTVRPPASPMAAPNTTSLR